MLDEVVLPPGLTLLSPGANCCLGCDPSVGRETTRHAGSGSDLVGACCLRHPSLDCPTTAAPCPPCQCEPRGRTSPRSQKHAPSSPAGSTPTSMCPSPRLSPPSVVCWAPSSSRQQQLATSSCWPGCAASESWPGLAWRAPAPTGCRLLGTCGPGRFRSWRSCGPTDRSAGATGRAGRSGRERWAVGRGRELLPCVVPGPAGRQVQGQPACGAGEAAWDGDELAADRAGRCAGVEDGSERQRRG